MTKHCHEMVAKVAKQMAGEIFETMMAKNKWYEAYKKSHPKIAPARLQNHFISTQWHRYVSSARTTLAAMLKTNTSPVLKEQIRQALILDNAVRRIRMPSTQRH